MSTQLSNGKASVKPKPAPTPVVEKHVIPSKDKSILPSLDSDLVMLLVLPKHRKKMIAQLNMALASKLVNMLRYRHQHSILTITHPSEISQNFLAYAYQELIYVDKIAHRIFELMGVADFSPKTLSKYVHAKHQSPKHIKPILKANLSNGRKMVKVYRKMITRVAFNDNTTCQILEEILADEKRYVAEQKCHLECIRAATSH